ncbi:MAG: dihydrolipoamide acetyltransferase family protein [Phycisphaerae bacterium]
MFEFKLPDLGEGVHEGQIVNVRVKEGDKITEYEPMLEVETDKAAVEIPSPKTGVIAKLFVKPGQTVKVGEVLVQIDTGAGAPAAAPAVAAKTAAAAPAKVAAASAAPVAKIPAPAVAATSSAAAHSRGPAVAPMPAAAHSTAIAAAPAARTGPIPAAPVVRKLARELGVDLGNVPASGPNGRVMREDVERFAKGGGSVSFGGAHDGAARTGGATVSFAAEPLPDFSQYGPVRREQPSQIRKTIARQMSKAWYNVPRVTHCDSADVTELEKNRKDINKFLKEGQPKMTMTAIVIKAVATCLRSYPMLNCSWDATTEEVVYKDFFNLGIAVDTPRGLVVPVIRDADKKSLPQLARDLNDMAEKARTVKFEVNDLRGATFTITNVGALGGSFVTPMVNYPEVGILGLGRAALQAVCMDERTIVPRLMLPLSLSFDHRICDGADAARFTRDVIGMLENPLRLISV